MIQEKIDQHLSCGGVIHEAARLPDLPGAFIKPTLITNCPPTDTLEEIFAPVTAVHMFRDDAEAIMLANQPQAAWSAYIFSADDARARQLAAQLQVSSVTINGVSLFGLHPQAPRTAWGLSGSGETGVTASIRFFGGTRTIGVASS
jgi:phenylacetaldehyde dehydrogenase